MRIFLNAIRELPPAEERRRARLEARTVLLQRFFDRSSQFRDSLFRGNDGWRVDVYGNFWPGSGLVTACWFEPPLKDR
jgi:hypothetical protein